MSKIDILLATYNGERYLAEQLESLLHQSNQEWRLIAHDDGSIDRTVDILMEYQCLFPHKIIIIDDDFRSGGAKNNFYHLMQYSDAPYIMFCDQDDIWLEDKVEVTFQRMLDEEMKASGKAVLVHTDLKIVDENLNAVASSMFDYQRLPRRISSLSQIILQNSVTGCTMMVNRRAVEVSIPMPREAIMHDWWIACKVVQHGGVVSFISRSVIEYRQHGGNVVGSKKVTISYYFLKFLNLRELASKLFSLKQQAYAINGNVSFLRLAAAAVNLIVRRML